VRSSIAVRAVALGIAALIAGCGATFHRSYTRDELRERVAKRFPVERKKMVFTARLTDPDLMFPGGDRLAMAANVEVKALGVVVGRGRATLEGTPRYRSEDGGIYLGSPELRSLELDGRSPEHSEKARAMASEAVMRLFAEQPIYTLDPARNAKEARARAHLRRLWVENDRLHIEFAL
jgi:hypothetical protein